MMKNRPNLHLVLRRSHLILGLFLSPWILAYALSTITMHHRALFTGDHYRVTPNYETVSKQNYAKLFASDTDRQSVAKTILADLGLEGAHSVRGDLSNGKIVIDRHRAIRSLRLTYEPTPATIQIERQEFGLAFVLEMLHRRSGYQQPYWTNDVWAVLVDLVIISILLWAISGVWMWWRLSPCRRPGFWCLGAGAALALTFFLTL